ncbi:hypothetical protein [Shewanella sp. SM21]|uniref:hypothetical protein n=1 Tax=Shewanella sp. SM21 TaxID=2912793 RepID=UPI0021DB7EB5|nr:hypothetical protein [Shewanella sp. SM21]MCU8087666.1 hypothetical protein [Shewanella sp. SM21]
MLEMVASIIILLCIFIAVKVNLAIKCSIKREPQRNGFDNQYEPRARAHRLCMQAHVLHAMPNDFSKIKADEDFKLGIKRYVKDISITAESQNTLSITVNNVTQLYPNSTGNKTSKQYN